MPRADSAEPAGAFYLTAAARGGLIALLAWEKSSGSGSARLDLSQKGGLPFPSETACSRAGPRPPTRAKTGKAPASAEARASRVPEAGGPQAGRTLTSPTSALRSSYKGVYS